MLAGDTCSGHSSVVATAVALFYGVCRGSDRPCHFIDPGFCQPAFVTPCASLCHFLGHAGGQALSFYRPQLLPEQACIEAIHVACLVAQLIYVHMKPAGVSHRLKKKPEASQKQSKPDENQNLVLNCLDLSETRTEIPTEITETRTEIRTDFRTDGMIGNNIIRTDCHMISIFCMSVGQTIDFMKIALGSGTSILFLKGSWPAVLYQ